MALALLAYAAALLAVQPPPGGTVWLLEMDGVINPLSDRYLARELEGAERAGARAVVLRIDTPGGLETSMREILVAEGDRQAAILRAEGFAAALEKIFEVARTVDGKTMALQYLDALRTLGAGDATKILLPVELTSVLRPFVEHMERSFGGGEGTEERRRAA